MEQFLNWKKFQKGTNYELEQIWKLEQISKIEQLLN
jgi:hypothetical protein